MAKYIRIILVALLGSFNLQAKEYNNNMGIAYDFGEITPIELLSGTHFKSVSPTNNNDYRSYNLNYSKRIAQLPFFYYGDLSHSLLNQSEALGNIVSTASEKESKYIDTTFSGHYQKASLGIKYQSRGSFVAVATSLAPGLVYSQLDIEMRSGDCSYSNSLGDAFGNVLGNSISNLFGSSNTAKSSCTLKNIQSTHQNIKQLYWDLSWQAELAVFPSLPISLDLYFKKSRFENGLGVNFKYNL